MITHNSRMIRLLCVVFSVDLSADTLNLICSGFLQSKYHPVWGYAFRRKE